MKKVLILDSWSGYGGGQRVAYDIVSGLRAEYHFVYMAPSGPYLELYKQEEVTSREILSKSFCGKINEVRRAIKEIKPDIIHAHGTRAAIWARVVLMMMAQKPKLVYTVHGFHLIRKSHIVRFISLCIERYLNRWVDILVCVSKHDCETIKNQKLINSRKIIIVQNGIDISFWQKVIVSSNDFSFQSEGKFIVGVICRLHPPKDVASVLHAFAQLNSVYLKTSVLLIVGDGPLRSGLEQLAKELHIDKQTIFVGDQKDVRPFLQLCNVLVLSTKWEGLPLVVLEAAACKKPVVISKYDGVEEVVLSEKTGLLFPFGSSKELKKQLERLMGSPELVKSIGDNAQNFVKEQFPLTNMIDKYKKIYQGFD